MNEAVAAPAVEEEEKPAPAEQPEAEPVPEETGAPAEDREEPGREDESAPAESAPEQESGEAPEEAQDKKDNGAGGGQDAAAKLSERLDELERRLEQRDRELREITRESLLRSHYSELERQAEELRRSIPEFSLSEALQEPEFLRLTSPGVGLSVENAYYALHHAQLIEQAKTRGALEVSESISSRAALPGENGSVRRSSLSSQPRLYSRMSPEERQEQKRMILSGMRF